jgi:hypothetical protein
MTAKEKYLEMTVPQLRKVCKERGLSRYANAKKLDLVDMLVSTELEKNEDSKNEHNCEAKEMYISKIQKGTIIAFYVDENEKVKSAKVIRKSSKDRMLKCVTNYGKEYLVKYSSVVWVKTGSRWPRGVYNLLKGFKEDGQESSRKVENEK